MTNRDSAMSFLLGAAMGAAAGILFAPAAGSETRHRLRRRGEESLDMGREALVEAKDTLNGAKETVRGTVESARDRVFRAKDGVQNRLEAARQAVDEGKAVYHRELDQTSAGA